MPRRRVTSLGMLVPWRGHSYLSTVPLTLTLLITERVFHRQVSHPYRLGGVRIAVSPECAFRSLEKVGRAELFVWPSRKDLDPGGRWQLNLIKIGPP
jgi:hypothetical protein